MRRITPWLLALVTLAVIAVPFALAASSSASVPVKADRSPGQPVAVAISTVTGIAISPLLGTGAYGAYQWMSAKDEAARAALPWFAQISFWLPALLLVGVCAAKDALGALPAALRDAEAVLSRARAVSQQLAPLGIPVAIPSAAK